MESNVNNLNGIPNFGHGFEEAAAEVEIKETKHAKTKRAAKGE